MNWETGWKELIKRMGVQLKELRHMEGARQDGVIVTKDIYDK